MANQFRVYGLMAGITIGFAVWGSTGIRSVSDSASFPAAETSFRQTSSCSVPFRQAGYRQTSFRAASDSQSDPLSLHAVSAALIDADSGRLLYGKDAQEFRPMASTTKIMTMILALENGTPEDVCTVSSTAAAQPRVHLGAPKGTEFYLKDLLYSLMLESHNDTAVVIAEHIGGSVEGFSEMMNQKARDIGCRDTCFITPNGLDAAVTDSDGTERMHGTTAADLAAILRYCIAVSPRREEFLAITQTQSHSFTDRSGKRSYYCGNHNALLTMLDGALTGKTGFTGGAGYSYVGALEDGGRTFIIALLGSGWPPHKTWKWDDAKKLFQYGKERYQYRDVFTELERCGVPVRNATEEITIPVSDRLPEEGRQLRMLLSEGDQVVFRTELPDETEAPVNRGDVLGRRICILNGEITAVWPLYAEASAQRWNFLFCMKGIFGRFLLKNGKS